MVLMMYMRVVMMMKMMMMMSRSWLFTSWQPSLAFQYVLMQAELVFATWSLTFRCQQIHIHLQYKYKFVFATWSLIFRCLQMHSTIMVATVILIIITKNITIIFSLLIILTTKILIILTTTRHLTSSAFLELWKTGW